MHIVSVLLAVWLIIGAIAAGQRGYSSGPTMLPRAEARPHLVVPGRPSSRHDSAFPRKRLVRFCTIRGGRLAVEASAAGVLVYGAARRGGCAGRGGLGHGA